MLSIKFVFKTCPIHVSEIFEIDVPFDPIHLLTIKIFMFNKNHTKSR